jgi:hypothetical protein
LRPPAASPDDRDVRVEIRRLLTYAALALLAFFVIYALAVQTEWGQRVDQLAFTGGSRVPDRAADAAGRLLSTVSVGGLIVGMLLLGAVAAARRRVGLILVPAAVISLTMISAEVLKHVLLERPELLAVPLFTENTYPSGHTATAISVGLAAVLVAPPRLRAFVAVLAFLAAAGFGVFVVTAGWHLPSDPLGAYALALAASCTVMAVVYKVSPTTLRRERAQELEGEPVPGAVVAGRLEIAGLAVAAAFFFGVIAFASLRYGHAIDWTRIDAAYLGSMAVIVFAAALTVSSLLRAISAAPITGSRPERRAR